jgi:hypothetical protein
MKIQTLKIHRKTAEKKYKEYLEAVKKNHPNKNYRELKEAFFHASKGRKLVDIIEVIKNAGTDENGRPMLAVIRADAEECYFEAYRNGGGVFKMTRWWKRGQTIDFREGTFTKEVDRIMAVVPTIPPRFRPKGSLYRYYILWEADWKDVPVDPILLKRVSKSLFVVLATWNLTAIERAALR